jgi:hypothetical protein
MSDNTKDIDTTPVVEVKEEVKAEPKAEAKSAPVADTTDYWANARTITESNNYWCGRRRIWWRDIYNS